MDLIFRHIFTKFLVASLLSFSASIRAQIPAQTETIVFATWGVDPANGYRQKESVSSDINVESKRSLFGEDGNLID